MKSFSYFMPTKILCGKDVIINNADLLKSFGKKAFIITGKASSKKNGSLKDLTKALEKQNIEYVIFDEVEENPSMEMVEKAASIGKSEKVDFIIGLGGGSSLDSAKGIGVLIKNKEAKKEDLFLAKKLESIEVIAIPTTAGTGSEVTQYAIFTDHRSKTKKGFSHSVFPKIAFLDAKYLMSTPDSVTINTGVDALSHLIEGYLTINASVLSDALSKEGMALFSECREAFLKREFTYEIREKLILMSTIAGMVIAESGTSLPHGMGYALTYFHNIPHGKANGLLLKEYLSFCEDKKKVNNILEILNMKDLDEFGGFLKELLGSFKGVNEKEINEYTETMINNKAKLKNHPFEVKREDILNIYKNSLM
ncbi:iron-containing alcohol dehydrogenase family protein [Haloimpatiens sp. FM7315]|uniref:iron-containing alcohol dehydrogenase family protein n=1 Tax=Haloimpatiens sp. FM7315 TaxID=3298609 RepID=UPI00370BD4FC